VTPCQVYHHLHKASRLFRALVRPPSLQVPVPGPPGPPNVSGPRPGRSCPVRRFAMPTFRETLSTTEQLAVAVRQHTPVRLAHTFASLEGQFYDRTPFDQLARRVHALTSRLMPISSAPGSTDDCATVTPHPSHGTSTAPAWQVSNESREDTPASAPPRRAGAGASRKWATPGDSGGTLRGGWAGATEPGRDVSLSRRYRHVPGT
jgi:hypothetical protein